MADPTERPFGHEPDAIAYRPILVGGAVLAAVLFGVAFGLHALLRGPVMPNQPALATRPARIPPRLRLQAHPQRDLAHFRAGKEAMLSGYAWLDAAHHDARIPIRRAMQIYVRQHAGSRPAPAASATPRTEPRP